MLYTVFQVERFVLTIIKPRLLLLLLLLLLTSMSVILVSKHPCLHLNCSATRPAVPMGSENHAAYRVLNPLPQQVYYTYLQASAKPSTLLSITTLFSGFCVYW